MSMTESKAIEIIQGKLDCMDKCDVFDCKGTDECESCKYCYSQGTFGEQKKALGMAIKALEKQIPKKFVWHKDMNGIGIMSCPTCFKIVPQDDYCCNCGQRVDWEDTKGGAK